MHRIRSWASRGSRGRAGFASAALAGAALVVASAAPLGDAAAQDSRRWDHDEPSYSDMNVAERAVTNVRDGLVGLVDSVGQAAFSASAIGSPYGGLLARKVMTFAGDVVGLVDDNGVTHHVLKGVLSRHLLRFGAGAQNFHQGLARIHDTEFDGPELAFEDYAGPTTFHPRAYVEPSGLAILGAVVLSDAVVRPIGSLITIFGFREDGQALDRFGKELIDASTEVTFF